MYTSGPYQPNPSSKMKVVVEVGHGARPLWTRLKNMPLDDQMYIGLDIDSDSWPPNSNVTGFVYRLDEGRNRITNRRLEGKKCFWLKIDDLGHIPLSRGSADELYMFGVLSDPRISILVIENLLRNVSTLLRPGGFFIIDNITSGQLIGPGDVLIDFDKNHIVFRCNSGAVQERELNCHASGVLNSSFIPLPYHAHEDFLRLRGLNMYENIDPGARFSILVKKY